MLKNSQSSKCAKTILLINFTDYLKVKIIAYSIKDKFKNECIRILSETFKYVIRIGFIMFKYLFRILFTSFPKIKEFFTRL